MAEIVASCMDTRYSCYGDSLMMLSAGALTLAAAVVLAKVVLTPSNPQITQSNESKQTASRGAGNHVNGNPVASQSTALPRMQSETPESDFTFQGVPI